jgi:2-polyprenyl-6-methoxyphenol hydroxylase-like FAD-dependent oxidoreductase
VTSIDQTAEGAEVQFESASKTMFDLVVIAEGVGSRTRDLVFDAEVEKETLGLNMAHGTIPRVGSDDRWWRWYTAPGRRGVTLRPDNVGTTRATLAFVDRKQNLADLADDEAKLVLARTFADAGWEAPRVAEAFTSSKDVYIDYLTQIKMRSWHQGHVAVTGDAAWCVTPLGGGGTSLALIGAYVLAAHLLSSDDLASGLVRYEESMRPLIADTQKLPKGTPNLFYPASAAGVTALRTFQRVLSAPPLRFIAARAVHVAGTKQTLPSI